LRHQLLKASILPATNIAELQSRNEFYVAVGASGIS
jgi:hypothetical protein